MINFSSLQLFNFDRALASLHRSGLLNPERHELVPVAPRCDAPGMDWDYVEWVRTSFVFPLLLELEQTVLENMMRHMVAPTPASRPGALSLFQTSHLTTPAASVPGTPRITPAGTGSIAGAVEQMSPQVQKLDKTLVERFDIEPFPDFSAK